MQCSFQHNTQNKANILHKDVRKHTVDFIKQIPFTKNTFSSSRVNLINASLGFAPE